MGWRILYLEEAMSAKLYLDNIKIIKENQEEVMFPLNDIHSLIIDNTKTLLTIPLLLKCSEYNINLIICNIEHMPTTIVQPICGNYQASLMLKKQIEWSQDLKSVMHAFIIRNKIENQVDLLKHYNLSTIVISKMLEFSSCVELDDITNREGLAAKMYFRELFGSDFKRFEEDILNAGLNYGYAILRSQISKTILSKGLNPLLGIFHRGYDNPFNLSDDVIEVFRPIIDEYVYKYLKDAIIFKKEHRIDLIKMTLSDVYIDGKKQSLFNAISIYLDKLIKIFETGDISSYSPIRLIYEL